MADTIWITSTRNADGKPVCELNWGPQGWYAPVADVRQTAMDLVSCAAYAEFIHLLITKVGLPPATVEADDTAYVQDFIDKGLRIPAGEYFCPGGVSIAHDYVDRAEAVGREHDLPPDYFALGDPYGVVIRSKSGATVRLGAVRRPLEPGREEPVVICRDDVAVYLPHPASLVLDQFAYEVPGGSPGGFIRD